MGGDLLRTYTTDYGRLSVTGGVITVWEMRSVSSETDDCIVVSGTRSVHRSFPGLPSVWALSVVVAVHELPNHVNDAAASGDDAPELLIIYAIEGLSLNTLVVVDVLEEDLGGLGLCLAMIATLPNHLTDNAVEYVVV